MLFPPVAKTLSKCLRVEQQVFLKMDTLLFSGHLGPCDALSHLNVTLTITNAISKNLPSSGTKWLPVMTYIHPLYTAVCIEAMGTILIISDGRIHLLN
jgi:hypothetical protein